MSPDRGFGVYATKPELLEALPGVRYFASAFVQSIGSGTVASVR